MRKSQIAANYFESAGNTFGTAEYKKSDTDKLKRLCLGLTETTSGLHELALCIKDVYDKLEQMERKTASIR